MRVRNTDEPNPHDKSTRLFLAGLAVSCLSGWYSTSTIMLAIQSFPLLVASAAAIVLAASIATFLCSTRMPRVTIALPVSKILMALIFLTQATKPPLAIIGIKGLAGLMMFLRSVSYLGISVHRRSLETVTACTIPGAQVPNDTALVNDIVSWKEAARFSLGAICCNVGTLGMHLLLFSTPSSSNVTKLAISTTGLFVLGISILLNASQNISLKTIDYIRNSERFNAVRDRIDVQQYQRAIQQPLKIERLAYNGAQGLFQAARDALKDLLNPITIVDDNPPQPHFHQL